MEKSSFKQVSLVQTWTGTSTRDEIASLTQQTMYSFRNICYFVVFTHNSCIANFMWFPCVLFDLLTFLPQCTPVYYSTFRFFVKLNSDWYHNLYHISGDYERLQHLSLMLQHYTIDMPSGIISFLLLECVGISSTAKIVINSTFRICRRLFYSQNWHQFYF